MPQVHEAFSQLTDFDPILTEIFYQQYNLVTPNRERVFGMRKSNKGKETDLRIGSFSDPRVFNGGVEYQTVQRDYDITYTHTAFASGFVLERELMDDMQYDSIFTAASEMGTSYARKQEKDAASVFNNAFDGTNYTGYDAKSLCSTTHPRSRTDSTTVSNYLTLTLSSANVETAITTMQAFKDDKGEEITIMPDLVIVPRNLRKKAHELFGSPLDPESANNASNVHAGMNWFVWPYLTDANAWFIVDSAFAKRVLKWYTRIPVEFAAQNDFDTFMRKYRGYMRYSYGWSDWRFIIGSNPS